MTEEAGEDKFDESDDQCIDGDNSNDESNWCNINIQFVFINKWISDLMIIKKIVLKFKWTACVFVWLWYMFSIFKDSWLGNNINRIRELGLRCKGNWGSTWGLGIQVFGIQIQCW